MTPMTEYSLAYIYRKLPLCINCKPRHKCLPHEVNIFAKFMKGAYCLHFVLVYIFLTFLSVHILYVLCIQRKSWKKVKKLQN